MLATPTDTAAVSAAALPSHDRILIWACLIAIAALAWGYLLHLDRQMSPAMEQGRMMAEMGMPMERPWSLADLLFTVSMWAVMMVGMMAAAAAPVVILFAATQTGRSGRQKPMTVLIFGFGYLAVWVGFSACAAVAQWVLHDAALLLPTMAASSSYVGGAILCAAGAYQLTPLKHACLKHCRTPLGFLMAHWRDGRLGALQMGMRHGAYCLGCCWALMCVLFVVGVMNLVWVAALAVLVLLEKVGPAGEIVARVAGVAMIVAGLLLLGGGWR